MRHAYQLAVVVAAMLLTAVVFGRTSHSGTPDPASGSGGGSGSGSGSGKVPDKIVPKITSVSPKAAAVDHLPEIDIVLRGTNLVGSDLNSDLRIEYDTDPSEGVRRCGAAVGISDTEVRCTLKAARDKMLADALPIDAGLHFIVSWRDRDKKDKKDGKWVTSEPSASTFTAQLPVLAQQICAVRSSDSELQVRLNAPGIAAGARVIFFDDRTTPATRITCSPQLFGAGDAICYLPLRDRLAKGLGIQIQRAGEHGGPVPSSSIALPYELVVDRDPTCMSLPPAAPACPGTP